jgi:transcriptional regulator with XRE-family HTH domain
MLMDGNTRQIIGANVKRLRLAVGWSQSELARHTAGVAQTTISALEKGAKSPSAETLDDLAHALRVPAWALFVPNIPTDADILRHADRLVQRYLTVPDRGRQTIDTIAEAEARYASVKKD